MDIAALADLPTTLLVVALFVWNIQNQNKERERSEENQNKMVGQWADALGAVTKSFQEHTTMRDTRLLEALKESGEALKGNTAVITRYVEEAGETRGILQTMNSNIQKTKNSRQK